MASTSGYVIPEGDDWIKNRLAAVSSKADEARRAAQDAARRARLPDRLSGSGAQVTNWNAAVESGFYWGTGAANQPPGGSGVYLGYVVPSGADVVQFVRRAGQSHEWSRVGTGGVFGEWVPSSMVNSGGTATRDAVFPPPSTDTARAKLANSRPVWFNTDLGWSEAYYAPVGTAGLTARPLLAGRPAGWYPVGAGPRLYLYGPTNKAASGWTEYNLWQITGTGASYRVGGLDWFVQNGSVITVQKHGYYRAMLIMTFPNGSGTGAYRFGSLAPNNSEIRTVEKAVPLLASYGQTVEFHMPSVLLQPGDRLFAVSTLGSWSTGAGAQMIIEYLGPPLGSE